MSEVWDKCGVELLEQEVWVRSGGDDCAERWKFVPMEQDGRIEREEGHESDYPLQRQTVKLILKKLEKMAYPESLLACAIWMPRITPQSSSYETSMGIIFRPRKARTRPVIARIILGNSFISLLFCQNIMFIRMESILLIVCCKFEKQYGQRRCGQQIIGRCKRRMRLKDGCHIGRQTKEEEKNILNGRDESKIYDLEQPSRDLSAENSPAVVFIFSGEIIGIIIQ